MYVTYVDNVTGIRFFKGDWHVKFDCRGAANTPFLSADTEMVYLPDEMTFDCDGCSEPECFVTKVERKKHGDSKAN